jgi:hypothetical protein
MVPAGNKRKEQTMNTTTPTTLTVVPDTATLPTTTSNDEWTSCRDVIDPASGLTLTNVQLA